MAECRWVGGEVGTSELDWIDNLAGGLPFYVQMAASMLWQYGDLGGDLAKARSEFIFQATPRFRELWEDLTASERIGVKQSVNGECLDSNAIVSNLQRHGLLRAEGSLFSRAFADFVRVECR